MIASDELVDIINNMLSREIVPYENGNFQLTTKNELMMEQGDGKALRKIIKMLVSPRPAKKHDKQKFKENNQ